LFAGLSCAQLTGAIPSEIIVSPALIILFMKYLLIVFLLQVSGVGCQESLPIAET